METREKLVELVELAREAARSALRAAEAAHRAPEGSARRARRMADAAFYAGASESYNAATGRLAGDRRCQDEGYALTALQDRRDLVLRGVSDDSEFSRGLRGAAHLSVLPVTYRA